jgi:hypothetical protein
MTIQNNRNNSTDALPWVKPALVVIASAETSENVLVFNGSKRYTGSDDRPMEP